jgi:CRP-like cAMP-binding protein
MQAMVDLMSLNFRTYLDITGTLMEQRPEHRVQSRILTLLSGEGNARTDGAIILPLSQEELASLCCVSRPTVNKILRQMEALGWVDLGYRCIKITNLNAIRNSCGAVTA